MHYAIYGRCDHGLSIDDLTLERLDVAFRPDNPEACVWIESDAPSVLRVSFDVDAVSDEDAISQGLQELESLTKAAEVRGHSIEITVMTDDHWAAWSPDRGPSL